MKAHMDGNMQPHALQLALVLRALPLMPPAPPPAGSPAHMSSGSPGALIREMPLPGQVYSSKLTAAQSRCSPWCTAEEAECADAAPPAELCRCRSAAPVVHRASGPWQHLMQRCPRQLAVEAHGSAALLLLPYG